MDVCQGSVGTVVRARAFHQGGPGQDSTSRDLSLPFWGLESTSSRVDLFLPCYCVRGLVKDLCLLRNRSQIANQRNAVTIERNSKNNATREKISHGINGNRGSYLALISSLNLGYQLIYHMNSYANLQKRFKNVKGNKI